MCNKEKGAKHVGGVANTMETMSNRNHQHLHNRTFCLEWDHSLDLLGEVQVKKDSNKSAPWTLAPILHNPQTLLF